MEVMIRRPNPEFFTIPSVRNSSVYPVLSSLGWQPAVRALALVSMETSRQTVRPLTRVHIGLIPKI